MPLTEILRARLKKLGMHFNDEQFVRAQHLVRTAGTDVHAIDDIVLMTIAVEAYRRPEHAGTEVA